MALTHPFLERMASEGVLKLRVTVYNLRSATKSRVNIPLARLYRKTNQEGE